MDVGVRELRGNLSKYLRDVRAGAELTVTDHGRPIARIVPTGERTIDRLIREGRVIPAAKPRMPLPEPIRAKGTVSDLISDQRD
jgi:prevent-host-death family protein